ncbi:DUF2577 domain-containing protein [Gemmiger formicilis]
MDAYGLTKAMKRAALDAIRASKPVEICFGKVTSASPLKILVDQKMTLGEAQLVLARNVTTFQTEVTVDWLTENRSGGSGDSSFASHNHPIKGRKKITVHNGLVVGDEVILFRQQGGQKYIVVDRIG